jgi:hypothetical protein
VVGWECEVSHWTQFSVYCVPLFGVVNVNATFNITNPLMQKFGCVASSMADIVVEPGCLGRRVKN